MSALRLKYNPALDGVRAVAIVLVFLSHAHAPLFDGAFFGVDLFFVLSGYLITSLLLKEYQQAGRLDFWRFYARRFLRLAPALLLFLAAYWVFAPLIWPDLDDVNQDVLVSALYLADYGIEKIVRDLRVHQILEGTNEIMRLIVARGVIGARA